MIVCSCNRIRETELKTAVACGHRSVDGVYRALGCAVQCGSCVDFADELIERFRPPAADTRARAA